MASARLTFFSRRLRKLRRSNPYSDHKYPPHCQDLFEGGKVVDYLKIVKQFLDANPNEVLTLLFTNPEGLSVLDVWKPAFDASGISSCLDPLL